jgi:hypothetical protein
VLDGKQQREVTARAATIKRSWRQAERLNERCNLISRLIPRVVVVCGSLEREKPGMSNVRTLKSEASDAATF